MAKKNEQLHFPPRIPEDGYPNGDGPQWVSRCFGLAGCLVGVDSYLSDEGGHHVLKFANGNEAVFRVDHVGTRRLTDTLNGFGLPMPYYSPPQLGQLGAAIARIGYRGVKRKGEDHRADICSAVETWADESCERFAPWELTERTGAAIRAAIEYVRHHGGERGLVPLIFEPGRDVLLAWTVPVRTMLRERFGAMSDGMITLQLARSKILRERVAARPGPGQTGTQELPVFALYNAQRSTTPEISSFAGTSQNGSAAVVERSIKHAHTRSRAHTHYGSERSTTLDVSGTVEW